MYPGGKNFPGTYQEIICQIPPHEVYIELFLGSGAILNNKKPARNNFGVEINPGTIDKFIYDPRASIYNEDVFSFISRKESWFMQKDTFVYMDPPYPIKSRSTQQKIYEYELTDEQHVELLKRIKKFKCMVAISTYKNDIYRDLLKGWRLHKFENVTHNGKAIEYLYMNYPKPEKLHDYNFLGKDFTDRQRIKRKIEREVNKLNNLPLLERAAIIDGISKNFSDIA